MTVILLELLARERRITVDQLADSYLKLIDWRYKFLLIPAVVLRVLALRYRRSVPGEPLERIARYMHDCMADVGMFGGVEPTEPKISMAAYFGMRWTNEVAEFISTVWNGIEFDDAQATALTLWALTEFLPSPPNGMAPSDQLNFAEQMPQTVVSQIFIRRALQSDKSRSGTLMEVLQDALCMSRGDFCRIAAQIAASYSRRDYDE